MNTKISIVDQEKEHIQYMNDPVIKEYKSRILTLYKLSKPVFNTELFCVGIDHESQQKIDVLEIELTNYLYQNYPNIKQ